MSQFRNDFYDVDNLDCKFDPNSPFFRQPFKDSYSVEQEAFFAELIAERERMRMWANSLRHQLRQAVVQAKRNSDKVNKLEHENDRALDYSEQLMTTCEQCAKNLADCQKRLEVARAAPGFGSLQELYPSILHSHLLSEKTREEMAAKDEERQRVDGAAYNMATQAWEEAEQERNRREPEQKHWDETASRWPDCLSLHWYWLGYPYRS